MNNRGLILSIVALSLAVSMLNLGVMISKHYYKPQITSLQMQVATLKKRKPIIIYQVDNAGSELVGKVTDKSIIEGHYTVTIGAYGKFLVSQKQYNSLSIGDDIPDYLKNGGN